MFSRYFLSWRKDVHTEEPVRKVMKETDWERIKHNLDDIIISIITLQIIQSSRAMKDAVDDGNEKDYDLWLSSYEMAVESYWAKKKEMRDESLG